MDEEEYFLREGEGGGGDHSSDLPGKVSRVAILLNFTVQCFCFHLLFRVSPDPRPTPRRMLRRRRIKVGLARPSPGLVVAKVWDLIIFDRVRPAEGQEKQNAR